nr:EOG090X0FII [Lepidurus arcticus]
MGEDKFENEELIKWGWPEDVWFHVDKLSSAHVYLRLHPGQTIDDVPAAVLEDAAQLVKANSIQGNKMNNLEVVYTMWSNLKKTPSMEVGQISFHKDKEDGEGFIKVSKKKTAKRKTVVHHQLPTTDSLEDFDSIVKRLEKCVVELRSSEFLTRFLDLLDRQVPSSFSEIVCYGLGRFSDCKVARLQCALLLILQSHLSHNILVFDPVFNPVEKAVLQHLNIHLILTNEEGKRSVAPQGTFFILPHCPKQLTNNLLYTNWFPEVLNCSLILSNSFSHIVESTPARILKQEAPYILRIGPYVQETALPKNVFHLDDVFNHLSFHSFPLSNFSSVEEDFWLDNPEPDYSETFSEEFVKLQLQ